MKNEATIQRPLINGYRANIRGIAHDDAKDTEKDRALWSQKTSSGGFNPLRKVCTT